MNLTDYRRIFKIILSGDSAVGKRSIRDRVVTGEFQPNWRATVGVPIHTKKLEVEGQDQPVKLTLWTPPIFSERRYELWKQMLGGTYGLILVYDITRESTFDNLSLWLTDAIKHSSQVLSVAIAGNKTDLKDSSTEIVKRERGNEFAERIANELNIPSFFLETSATTGENISELLAQLVDMMIMNDNRDPFSFS